MRRSAVQRMAAALMFAAVVGAAARADAQNYTYTKIMVPGSTWTEASGINDAGVVVGTYTDALGIAHAFKYENGVYTTIDFPDMAHNYAFGINNAGHIVGSFSPVMPRGPYSASLFADGAWSAYDFPGHETDGRAINASGHIVGIYNAGVGTPDHGFLKVGDTYTGIDFPGAPITYVLGLNDAGLITGTYQDAMGVTRGFVYNGGTYSSIMHPTASETVVAGINNANSLVGWKFEGGRTGSYVLSQGKYRPVIVPFNKATDTEARAINNAGAIVGSYLAPDCVTGCSFLATPAPSAAPICNQSIGMTYSGGILTAQFTVRTSVPTAWTVWVVVGNTPFQLWSLQIPAIEPANSASVPISLPPSGNVLLASFIGNAANGTMCVDFTSLNTGS